MPLIYTWTLGGVATPALAPEVSGQATATGHDLRYTHSSASFPLVNGDLQLTYSIEAVRQNVNIACMFFLGEWFIDTRRGLPWFQSILGKGSDLPAIRATIRDAILAVPGVRGTVNVSLSFDRSSRTLLTAWSANSDFGEISDTLNQVV